MYQYKPINVCAICKIPYNVKANYGDKIYDEHSICRECLGSRKFYNSNNKTVENTTTSQDCRKSVCTSSERNINESQGISSIYNKSEEQTNSECNKYYKLNYLNRPIPINPKELFEKTITGELGRVGFDPKIDYLRRAGLLEVLIKENGSCNESKDNANGTTSCVNQSVDEVSGPVQSVYRSENEINNSYDDASKKNQFSTDSLSMPERNNSYLESYQKSKHSLETSIQDQEIHISPEEQTNKKKSTKKITKKKINLIDSDFIYLYCNLNLQREALIRDLEMRIKMKYENEINRISNFQQRNEFSQNENYVDTNKNNSSDEIEAEKPKYVTTSTQKSTKIQEDKHKTYEKQKEQQKENNVTEFSVEKLINVLKMKSNVTLQEVQRILNNFTSNKNKDNTNLDKTTDLAKENLYTEANKNTMDLIKDKAYTEADQNEKEVINMSDKFKNEIISLQTFVNKNYEGAYADFSIKPPKTITTENLEETQWIEQIQRNFDGDDSLFSDSKEILSFESDCSRFLHNLFLCPITRCEKIIFSSELTRHIQTLHPEIPLYVVSEDYTSVFFDLQIHNTNYNNTDVHLIDNTNLLECHCLFLLSGKIKNVGNTKYKNHVPILLMSTKINSLDLINIIQQNDILTDPKNFNNYKKNINIQNCYIIWLTGLIPLNDMKIHYSIKLRINNFDTFLRRDGILFSIQNVQKLKVLYRDNHTIVITENQYNDLTNYGQNLIECQVKFE